MPLLIRRFLDNSFILFAGFIFLTSAYAQPITSASFKIATEEDGSPECFGSTLKFANGNVTDNADGTCSVADQDSGGGGGDSVTVDSSAVDTTAEFTSNDIIWTLADGGAGGPDVITGTVACNGCVDAQDIVENGVGESELGESMDFTATGTWTFSKNASGVFTEYDAIIGDGTNAPAALQIGGTGLYNATFSNANLDLGAAFVIRQEGNLEVGNDPGIEFAFMEGGNTIRMAIPESGADNATAFIRSGTFAGPYSAAVGNDIVSCDQWTTFNDNIDCDTSGTGADLFVQDDLEVEGEIYLSGSIFGDADDASQHQIVFANATADHVLTIPDDTIADLDILIGNGAGTFIYAPLSGDATMDNAGAVTVVDDLHAHVITNIDSFTKANLETQTSDVSDYAEADGDTYTGEHDFNGATFEPPNSTADVALADAGNMHFNTTDEQLSFHSAADGEISGEAAISLLRHWHATLDPAAWWDQETTYRVIPIMTVGVGETEGITITEWEIDYVGGDPTTEFAGDLICDTTADYNRAADATVMDVLDTTAGASSASTGFDSATCANGSKMYIDIDSDPTDANVMIAIDIWFYNEED